MNYSLRRMIGFPVMILISMLLLACGENRDVNPEIVAYLEADDSWVIFAFHGNIGQDFTVEAGDGNEVIFTVTPTEEEYEQWSGWAESRGETLVEHIERRMDTRFEGRSWFEIHGGRLRESIGLEYLTITIVYRIDGREVIRESFEATVWD